MQVTLGVDVGTSSTKGVLVGLDGSVVARAVRHHAVTRPRAGWVESSADSWWDEFCSIARELVGDHDVVGVGVSGMGPCLAVADEYGSVLRPAILYGVDTRASSQIDALNALLGIDAILERCGSALSSQALGPKILWLAENEPEVFAAARRLFMPASWLAYLLTGEYVLDYHSASQCTPLFDTNEQTWYAPWAEQIVGHLELPRLVWADAVVGHVTASAAAASGLPVGVPVVSGTIDAWTEAISVDAHHPGDLMLMYGTTMFLVNTVEHRVSVPTLWGPLGALEGTRSVAGGMATSGAITSWLRELVGSPDYSTLLAEADASGCGARGLLMLPYFAGERTPLSDPDARGVVLGLSLQHTRGDLYRAALEATAFAVRHNIDAIREAGGTITRVVAVGGGTQGTLWTQIVSDVTGYEQIVPRITIGASYGAASLAAKAVTGADIAAWNEPDYVVRPRPEVTADYDSLWQLYQEAYPATAHISHALAARQSRAH